MKLIYASVGDRWEGGQLFTKVKEVIDIIGIRSVLGLSIDKIVSSVK